MAYICHAMCFVSVREFAAARGIAESAVRRLCARGAIDGARREGRAWRLPACATVPGLRPVADTPLLRALREQREARMRGGIYHRTQIELTFNSNHMEGSRLSKEQTRYIFETNTIGASGEAVRVDDVVETVNHFACVDYVIDHAAAPLTEKLVKHLHAVLKRGTTDAAKPWFVVGGYKRLPNEVGGEATTAPARVGAELRALLRDYNAKEDVTLADILDFHHRFETIHPFQDGNGRVGRLLMFKECLACGIVPFVIDESLKMFYYRGLREWPRQRGYLTDTCLAAQDNYKALLDYFKIGYRS